MTRPTARVVWDPAFTAYNFGPEHPMAPIRLDLTAHKLFRGTREIELTAKEFKLLEFFVTAAGHPRHLRSKPFHVFLLSLIHI